MLDVSRFSNWLRLVRSQAFVLRFVHNSQTKEKSKKNAGPFTSTEIRCAEEYLFKVAQINCYPGEVMSLLKSKDANLIGTVERTSIVYNRSPYLDDSNVLRVKGRIDAAQTVSDDVKRPIILPANHAITRLLVDFFHRRYHHLCHETVINELQQRYSIPKVRVALRTVRSNCQSCKNQGVKPIAPEMSDLPPARLSSFTRPFSYVGIDYFGPMIVTVGRRSEKRWGVLITCLTVRAIHVDVAYSLNTDSCILAIRNFIARRGRPLEIFSDNGTNFHGANNELIREWQQVETSDLQKAFTSSETKWSFSLPASPHMGGSWERLVGSVKKILYQIKPSRNPSDEVLRSLLIEIENIVNSRPLTYVAIESRDDEALTPNHFLLGSTDGIKPPGCFSSDEKCLRKNWKISQQMASFFWKRWCNMVEIRSLCDDKN